MSGGGLLVCANVSDEGLMEKSMADLGVNPRWGYSESVLVEVTMCIHPAATKGRLWPWTEDGQAALAIH